MVKTRVVHSEVNKLYRVEKLVEDKHWFRTEVFWATIDTYTYREFPDSPFERTKAQAEEIAIKRAKAYATDEVVYES